MRKLKVLTLVGTRPEIIKLSLVLKELDKYTDHILVHSGQNYDYELNEVFFRDLEIRKPDHFLEAAGLNASETIANVISKFDKVLEAEKPDSILIYGDTNSCLGVIPAKRRKIPVFHMEAGNRCFDQRVPEELNRKIVDHLSDVNIVHSEHARRYLLSEGLRSDLIFKSGSPMPEILSFHREKIKNSSVIMDLGLEKKSYFLVSLHREENVDSPKQLKILLDTLKGLNLKYEIPVVVSTHPRTRKRLGELGYSLEGSDIRFLKPFGFFDYLNLQVNSYCTLSDSGTITEESSVLNFPAIMLRETHERPEGMDQTSVVMAGIKLDSVLRCVELTVNQVGATSTIEDYTSINVSKKIVRLIHSYTDYVNRVVWKKGETV